LTQRGCGTKRVTGKKTKRLKKRNPEREEIVARVRQVFLKRGNQRKTGGEPDTKGSFIGGLGDIRGGKNANPEIDQRKSKNKGRPKTQNRKWWFNIRPQKPKGHKKGREKTKKQQDLTKKPKPTNGTEKKRAMGRTEGKWKGERGVCFFTPKTSKEKKGEEAANVWSEKACTYPLKREKKGEKPGKNPGGGGEWLKNKNQFKGGSCTNKKERYNK